MNTSTPALTEDILKPSAAFRKEASKSIISILAFILVYFILFALSLVLVAACFYGGVAIIAFKATFYTLVFALGLMGTGIMIFVFLVKFLFATSKENNDDSIQIKKEDHPALFEMIYTLAEETGTSKPRKVFLTHDVNASVSYNSSFWSMFLPIRKNLKIGLGLVNTVNASELKAVIAHEFGHFSQKSMKVGSWVYQVNKIIHNLLFSNTSYAQTLEAAANTSNIISFFVMITSNIVSGIQWVLKQMYTVVNTSYMALSREMEFHADLVAASVCGSNNIINALNRTEFGDVCFRTTIDLCNDALKEKKTIPDFYNGHRLVIGELAATNQIPLSGGLPSFSYSGKDHIVNRVNVKDQWASHPTTKDRGDYLKPFKLEAEVDTREAWIYFNDADDWKRKLTGYIYADVTEDNKEGFIQQEELEKLLASKIRKYSYPVVFKEYYDNRQLKTFDPESVVHEPFTIPAFNELLTDELSLLGKKIQFHGNDVAILKGIVNKEIITRSFDFDGQKYPAKKAAEILAILESELEQLELQLEESDKKMFRYFYAIAPLDEAEALKEDYKAYFRLRTEADEYLDKINKMTTVLMPIYQGQMMQLEDINAMISALKNEYEQWFKEALGVWKNRGALKGEPELVTLIDKFIAADYQYFSGQSFFDNELSDLDRIVQGSWSCISDYIFILFKNITEKQASMVAAKNVKEAVVV